MMDDANNMTIGNPITKTRVIGTADNITATIPVGYKLESITCNGQTINSMPKFFKSGTQNIVYHLV